MKRLSLLCSLVLVFALGIAHAQQYEVALSGSKAFTTHENVAPGGTIYLDIYLTGAGAPQNAGGVYIDFSASTDAISYVNAGIASPPWPEGPRVTVIPPDLPGIVIIVVSNPGGTVPGGGGDIPIGWITFQSNGPGAEDATIAFTTIPSVSTWSPLNDEDILPGSLVISQVCAATTDADCDDGNFCNGVETWDGQCGCIPGTPPCDDGGECTLDCDEDADLCLMDVCDTSVLDNDLHPCCQDSPCAGDGADPQSICSDSDTDGDGIEDTSDNCFDIPNPGQEDTYPPEGNGIGDACECEADFNCDGGVDATDVTSFLVDFGRNQFNDPCSTENSCDGDFNCDTNVDATDVTKLIEDFGRNQFNNACPVCVIGDWCGLYQPPPTGVEGKVYHGTTPFIDIKVSLLNGSTQDEITYTHSDENGNYEIVYDTPGYYCLYPDPPSSEYASIAYCASWFIQEGEMIRYDIDLTKKLVLTSPPHMEIISDTTPTLLWEANPSAVLYELYVEDLGSNEVVVSQTGIAGTSYTIPDPLLPGVYYWSVQGYGAANHLVAFGGAQFTIEE